MDENYLSEFKRIKNEGLAGLAKGIPFAIDRLNAVIPGVQKQRLYLLGGASGSGKTKTANEQFMFNVFDTWLVEGKRYPLLIHYFSLEMPRSQIVVALVLRWLYRNHGVFIDAPYLLGYVKGLTLKPFYNELLESEELATYITEFSRVAKIMDTHLNHISFSNYVKDLASTSGTTITKEIVTKDGKALNMFDSYTEKNNSQVNIIIVDHIGLVKSVTGQSERQMMVDMGDIMIKARNRYNFTFVVTQQLNRNFGSSDRAKLEDILPKDIDFRAGSAIFDAADVVVGLLSPNRERQNSFMGYRIQSTSSSIGFGNRLVSLNIIKNRHGSNNAVLPLLFLGEIGHYEELPRKSSEFNYDTLLNYKKHY